MKAQVTIVRETPENEYHWVQGPWPEEHTGPTVAEVWLRARLPGNTDHLAAVVIEPLARSEGDWADEQEDILREAIRSFCYEYDRWEDVEITYDPGRSEMEHVRLVDDDGGSDQPGDDQGESEDEARIRVAHEYTIDCNPWHDFDAEEADLYWIGGDRYRLEITRFTGFSHIDMDEEMAIEWLTDAINADPNVTVAYSRSQRTIVDHLPEGSRLAEIIRPLDEGRFNRDEDWHGWRLSERRDWKELEVQDEN